MISRAQAVSLALSRPSAGTRGPGRRGSRPEVLGSRARASSTRPGSGSSTASRRSIAHQTSSSSTSSPRGASLRYHRSVARPLASVRTKIRKAANWPVEPGSTGVDQASRGLRHPGQPALLSGRGVGAGELLGGEAQHHAHQEVDRCCRGRGDDQIERAAGSSSASRTASRIALSMTTSAGSTVAIEGSAFATRCQPSGRTGSWPRWRRSHRAPRAGFRGRIDRDRIGAEHGPATSVSAPLS